MKIKLIGFMLVLSIFLAGCNTQQQNASTSNEDEIAHKEQLKVYTTLYPLEDFIKKIGGDYVDVESIMPPGADAHTFEPTTKQMTYIAEADAFIYNGLGMEPFAEKMGTALKNEKVRLIEATDGIESIVHEEDHLHQETEHEHAEEDDHSHEEDHTDIDDHDHEDDHAETDNHDHHGHDHGDFDPHVWLDPYRSIILAENIKNTLTELNPDGKEDFEKNFLSVKAELEKLDEEFHELVEAKEHPEMIVSHAAYGYWEESYGIHQIPVAGLSPTDEPTQRDLEKIIKLAREKQIKHILFEQNVTQNVAEIIRKEINAEPLYLHNLEALTKEDRKNGEDYFSIMRKNLETLGIALK
ncbi:metal ABC transporter solute-binding protein, Zn/Mn family [Bacillus dakarensis]|uniref:metal ABC transporter solute-binding protein, Zn/Mn family n=1 Tax=Robertmurraya dakarensis TaxID=1926278 RepID=UPI000980C52E|nr:zinc ABC transporter substrate-binding protein [Bacillus dakarensis]